MFSHYDKESDVLYVTVSKNIDESYVEEVDDFLLIERSMRTNSVTGYRILNISKWANIFKV